MTDAGFRWRALCGVMALGCVVLSAPARAQGESETIDQALCRMIEGAAARHRIPVDFFTRLIWQESSFRPGVSSRVGAQGVAQFMPGTASERGLANPFDPEQAVPKSAELLSELRSRFGNLGLAAAAYNGGPARVEAWLAGRGGLPGETRGYVSIITGRSADDWASDARAERGEALRHRIARQIRTAHLIAEIDEHFGNAAHARAADPDEVNVFDDMFHCCFPSGLRLGVTPATVAQICATCSVASGFASERERSAIAASEARVWLRNQSASASADRSRCCTSSAAPLSARNAALVVW